MLQAPDFHNREPNFTERPSFIEPPPDYTTNSAPWHIPRASIKTKQVESVVNAPARSTLSVVPFHRHWEKHVSEGMILFVNKRQNQSNSVVAGTIPTINYFLEEGARQLYLANTTTRKRTHDELVRSFEDQNHIYAHTISEFVDKWKIHGCVQNIMGTPANNFFPIRNDNGEIFISCDVAKKTNMFDIWGGSKDGDNLYLLVKMNDNYFPFFYNPDGISEGLGNQSPPRFLQIMPVNMGSKSSIPIHNTNHRNLNKPNTTDIDFVSHTVLPQQLVEVDPLTGNFTFSSFSKSKGQTTLGVNLYQHGLVIPIGKVIKGDRTGKIVTEADTRMALRSNLVMQKLPLIEVALFQ